MTNVKQREIWLDNVKVFACILVLLGHFFQSMTKAAILPANDLYKWFNQTIYYFHVPLFFICSGYLYQKLSKVNTVRCWSINVLKKALTLGVPYFSFSLATWLLKTLFSESVNSEIGGLADILFLHPTSPYWYLYALFFLFSLTPTFKNRTTASIGLSIAFLLKVFGIVKGSSNIPVISYIISNEIWFVIGMWLYVFEFQHFMKKRNFFIPVAIGIVFLTSSVMISFNDIQSRILPFVMGLTACCSVLMIMEKSFENRSQPKFFEILAQYTMPIFLMHTLFAASLRSVLLKIGICSAGIHMVLGITISFIGPMFAAIIMKQTKWMEFFLYPGKFIKIK